MGSIIWRLLAAAIACPLTALLPLGHGGVGTIFSQSIISISPLSASFTGDIGSANTAMTVEAATLSQGTFSGQWSLSGLDAAKFVIDPSAGTLSVGSSDLPSSGSPYHVNLIATQSGVNPLPPQAMTITANPGPVNAFANPGIALSTTAFATPANPNTALATISALMSVGSSAGVVFAPSTTGLCSGANGADNSKFAVAGTSFNVAGAPVNAGTYRVCLSATLGRTTNSPAQVAFTLVGANGVGCGGQPPSVSAVSSYKCATAVSDEFSGSSLDLSKWQMPALGGNVGGGNHCSIDVSPPCTFDPANTTVGNGVVSMTATYTSVANGGDGLVHHGGFKSKSGNYGPIAPYYIELRVKEAAPFPSQGYMSGGFWWFGQPCSSSETEIDAGPDSGKSTNGNILLAYNYFDWTCSFSQNSASINDATTSLILDQFHVYGIWVPGDNTVNYYVDGAQYAQLNVPSDVNSTGRELNVSQQAEFGGSIDTSILPAVYQIDYYRVYCPTCN